MTNFKFSGVFAAVTAAMLMSAGAPAMADSTTDIVNALMAKGILTEEEGELLLKGRNEEKDVQTKAIKKAGKVTISDAIDNATVYGDIRVRGEYREGEDEQPGAKQTEQDRTRTRYKLTLGVKTTAGDFYSDLALAMGTGGRSDNATFGVVNGANNKDAILVKRAMLGWNVTDWLAVEAGRVANPLYTTSMVWDGDLTVEGLAEKVNFKAGNADVFLNAFQAQYEGNRVKNSVGKNDVQSGTNALLAFQGGAKFKLTDDVSAKAALTYYAYTNKHGYGTAGTGNFTPAVGNGSALGTNPLATNDLSIIEIPAEIGFNISGDIAAKVFGDYALNLDGNDRYQSALKNSAGAGAALLAQRKSITKAGNDDQAWLLGVGVARKQDKKPKQGDWAANVWYQDVGAYALDPNTPDSDFFDSRVNMKGVVLKTEYNVRDNVVVNFAAGHGSRKDDAISAIGSGNDISLNIDSYDLYQLDLTYKY